MLGDLLINNVWLAIGLVDALFVGDYLCSVILSRMYHRGVDKHFAYGGEVHTMSWVGMPLILPVLVLSALTYFIGRETDIQFFKFWLGGVFLMQPCRYTMHLHNLLMYRSALSSRGLRGRLELAPWLALRGDAVYFLAFGGAYLLCFLLSGSLFVLGGTITCSFMAFNRYRKSSKILMLDSNRDNQTSRG